MNAVLKIFLSLSVSGGLLILMMLLGKRFLKDKMSRQWQYYIWLVVIVRLLFPFGPEVSLLGKTYQTIDQAITQTAPATQQEFTPDTPSDHSTPPAAGTESDIANRPIADDLPDASLLQDVRVSLIDHVWLIWLMVMFGMLIRKITIYQSFIRYIRAGMTPVSDMEQLDWLSRAAEQLSIKKPIELCINPLVSSPLLTGFFHPCVVLPDADISQKDFQYIILHELIHYKRRDIFYKWLVQITVCLHWFNPFVYLMEREVSRSCEFSCDEAVLEHIGSDNAQDYGKTLLDAMAAIGRYKEKPGPVTLNENKQLLKERLGAIMRFQKQSGAVRILSIVLTMCVVLGASFVGVYSAAAATDEGSMNMKKSSTPKSDDLPATDDSKAMGTTMKTLDINGKTYYLVHNETQLRAIGTGAYGMDKNYMQQADIQLSADEWAPIGTWKNPFTGTFTGNGFEITGLTMTDPDAEIIGLFGVAKHAHIYNVTLRDYDIMGAGKNAANKSVGAILAIGQGSRSYDNFVYPKEAAANAEDDSSQIEKHYKAGSLKLFRIAFSKLDEKAQSKWLDKIYTDNRIQFWDAAIKLLEEDHALIQRYAKKTYTDSNLTCFYILTQNMSDGLLEKWLDKALKDKNLTFQSVLFHAMDQDEAFEELLENMSKGDRDVPLVSSYFPAVTSSKSVNTSIPVDLKTVAAGETIFLGEYTLSSGDKIGYDISAETGKGMKVFFAKNKQKNPVYWSVHNLRQPGEPLRCAMHLTVPSIKSGIYKSYLKATNGALRNVKGSVSFELADGN